MNNILNQTSTQDIHRFIQESDHIGDEIGNQIFLDWIIGISLVLLVVSLLMVCITVLRRIIQNRKKAKTTWLKSKYQDFLAEFISFPTMEVAGIAGSSPNNHILHKKDIYSPWRRSILIEELYQLVIQMQGQHARILRQLFLGYAFQEDTAKAVVSRRFIRIINGLKHASAFHLDQLLPSIKPLVLHTNIDIRTAAIMATITLENGDISILRQLKQPLTNWEKHKILDLIENHPVKLNIDKDLLLKEHPNQSTFITEMDIRLNPQPIIKPLLRELIPHE